MPLPFPLIRTLQLALLFGCSVLGAQDAPSLSTNQWLEDIDYLESTIRSVHPDPFFRIEEEEFDSSLAGLRADAKRLSQDEMIVAMMRFVAILEDGHSGLAPSGSIADFGHIYSVRIDRFSDGLFVTAAPKEHADWLGARVETYGNLKAEEAWKRAGQLVEADNQFSRAFRTSAILTLARAMKVLGAVDDDQLELGLVMPDGTRTSASIPSVEGSTSQLWMFVGMVLPDFAEHVNIHNTLGKELDLAYSNTDKFYWHEYLPKEHTLYVNFKIFLNQEDLPIPGFSASHSSLGAFIDDMWKTYDSTGAKRLVIDIRDNPGGNNLLLAPLLDGITARPLLNQRGHLYAITGGETYSAAMNCVSLLAERTEVLFVGEPAGGSPIHAGDSTAFSLPNSQLDFSLSTYRWQVGSMPWQQEAWLMPQIPVPTSADDYFAGRDRALRTILEGAVPLSDVLLKAHREGGLKAIRARYAVYRQDHPDTSWWTPVSDLSELAQRLEDAGEGVTALGVRKWAAGEFPSSLSAQIMLGKQLMENGDSQAARAAFEAATKIDPANRFVRRLTAAMTK